MSRTRSPNYPFIDLKAAITAVTPVFTKEKRNRMPKEVLAQHLGYAGINGRSLGMIGAVRAYGLIEGSGDEMRVSDEAITLINAPEETPEWGEALKTCALKPPLYRELATKFDTTPSEGVLRYTLIKMGYTPEAAAKAIPPYLATMSLVGESAGAYNLSRDELREERVTFPGLGEVDRRAFEEAATMNARTPPEVVHHQALSGMAPMPAHMQQAPGTRREVVSLDEGDVTITFPEALSPQSFEDLKDHLDLFVRKMQRRSREAPVAPPAPRLEQVSRSDATSNAPPNVSLMITQAQREALRQRGLSEEEIRNMQPIEAHRFLGLSQ
jgi:hypothetical protein